LKGSYSVLLVKTVISRMVSKGSFRLLCDTVQYCFWLKWLVIFLLNHFTSGEIQALETETGNEN
jgi:hypothetical protein